MADKNFPGRSALEALFGVIKSALSSKQNQTLSTTIAGSSTVEGALQALEQSYSGLDYSELNNKPQINGVELSGNKTASELGITIPTNLSDLNDDSTHRLVTDTEKSTWNGKADTADITNAISALDVSSVGGTGKYISEISEADGKINAVVGTMDDVPTENSNAPVKSGGIKTAIDNSVSLKTVTGNPITLTDAANANAEELSMTIEPIQDLHGYSKPWAGGGGKNKFGEENVVDRNTIHSFNVLTGTCKVTTTETNVQTQSEFYINDVSDWIGRTMTFSIKDYELSNNELKPYIVIYKNGSELTANLGNAGEGIIRTSASFTVTSDTTSYLILIRVSQGLASVGDYVQLNEIQLEIGSERTTFEPYANICPISGLTSGEVETTDGTDANTATITFGQTVYGGSVNFKTGEVTVTHKMVDLGTVTYYKFNVTQGTLFRCGVSDIKPIAESVVSDMLCSAYPTKSSIERTNISISQANNTANVDIIDSRYTDTATFKTAMSGVQLCYELATPLTLTLTPAELELLKGNNTITANGAEISIEYYPNNAIGALAGRVDDVQEQIAGLTANTLTGIDISAYSSAGNQYTAPTDGYVRMELRNENQYFYLYVNNVTLLGGEGHQVTNANDYMTVFVRKGMKLYYNGTVQTAVFYSLT